MAIKFQSPFVKVETPAAEQDETTETHSNIVADVVTGKPTREALSKVGKKVKDAQVGSRLGYALFVIPTKAAIATAEGASNLKEKAGNKLVDAAVNHEVRKDARKEKENQVEVVEVVAEAS